MAAQLDRPLFHPNLGSHERGTAAEATAAFKLGIVAAGLTVSPDADGFFLQTLIEFAPFLDTIYSTVSDRVVAGLLR
jgi:hypothetical protein